MAPRQVREQMERLARGEAVDPAPGIVDLLGLRLVALEEGRAVIELVPDSRHLAAPDARAVFGGTLACLADLATGLAYTTTLAEGEGMATLELQLHFLRPARPGLALRAEGRVRKAGGSTGFVTCEIADAAGQLVAHATATCFRLGRRDQADAESIPGHG